MSAAAQPIPPFVEEVYEFLKNEIHWLHGRWVIFEQLYRKGELRLELLNETAPSFFHQLQLLMYDDLQLGLARLTDNANDKASLLQLQKRLESHANNQLATKTKGALDKLMEAVKVIRQRRDEMIAHYALTHATGQQAEPPPEVEYQEIVASLELVRDYMNLIEQHYHATTQGYEYFAWQDDGDSLVRVLRWSMRYWEELKAKGKYIEPPDKWSKA